MPYVVCGRRFSVKALLSILLGLMLATSTLVGIAYATPTVQPTQSTSGNTNTCAQMSPSNPNYKADNCGTVHDGGNGGRDPPHGCFSGRIGTDAACACDGITPHSFEVSDIQADCPG
jgi:hypothetical protein